jgi:hypothetical protein
MDRKLMITAVAVLAFTVFTLVPASASAVYLWEGGAEDGVVRVTVTQESIYNVVPEPRSWHTK